MSASGPIEVLTFTSPGFQQNAYLAVCPSTGRTVAIDPGGEARAMVRTLADRAWTLDAVLLTHAHLDHIEGVGLLVAEVSAPVHLHPSDLPLYEGIGQQAGWLGVRAEPQPPVNEPLEDGQRFRFGAVELEVQHVPGHSPGHVMFYCEAAGVAFVGDVVFMGSIGRTDLPGGDLAQLMDSLRSRLLRLPDATVLYPGHGPVTTVGHERVSNPFIVPLMRGGTA